MKIGAYSLTIVASYLIGSLPTGYLAGKMRGIDIRAAGSGNIGATNVFRVLGKTAGTAVLLVDGLKGFAAARWIPLLAVQFFPGASRENLALAAGAAAVLGHVCPCWLKFKGGKGIVFLATKYVSIASLVAAVVLPIAVWAFGGGPKMTIVMTALAVLAIYKHKGNIARLLNGTESRFGQPKNPPPP